MSLDSVLNILVPFGVFAFFGFKMYETCQGPADRFFAYIGKIIKPDEEEEVLESGQEIVYV